MQQGSQIASSGKQRRANWTVSVALNFRGKQYIQLERKWTHISC